jgi:hypothetical protein
LQGADTPLRIDDGDGSLDLPMPFPCKTLVSQKPPRNVTFWPAQGSCTVGIIVLFLYMCLLLEIYYTTDVLAMQYCIGQMNIYIYIYNYIYIFISEIGIIPF